MTGPAATRVILLVDGEHSPSVVESAVESLSESGTSVAALVFLGGTEKADPDHYPIDIPLISADRPEDALAHAVVEFAPDEVVDLSDHPVVTQRTRETLIAVAASLGVAYSGPGYRFSAPVRSRLATLPTIAIVGTGKRTGKTAVCAALARSLAESGEPPLIVTMGRGGPKQPVYIPPGRLPGDPVALVELADDGLHAASDYIEDALFTGLPSIGAWRCGGGLLGETGPNVVGEAVRLAGEKAIETRSRLLLLEGSGSAIPPVHADVTVTVTPWQRPLETAGDTSAFSGLGLYRLLVADAVVTTMCPPETDLEELDRLTSKICELRPGLPVVHTTFELAPAAPIRDRRVVLATTASEKVSSEFRRQLGTVLGATVVGVSTNLSRRDRLVEDLSPLLPEADVLLTELKAGAVDVAVRKAMASGVEVIFVENRPRPMGDDGALEALSHHLLELARKRFDAGE